MTGTKIRFYRFVHQVLINCYILRTNKFPWHSLGLQKKNQNRTLFDLVMATGDRDLIDHNRFSEIRPQNLNISILLKENILCRCGSYTVIPKFMQITSLVVE